MRKKKPSIREIALEHGLSFPYDEDLISLILGSGTKDMPVEKMSRQILEVMDDSNEDEIVDNLLRLKGVGVGKALSIAAALELGKRRNSHIRAPIGNPRDIIPFVQNYSVSEKEHFVAVSLSGSHEIIKINVISVGTLNRALIHPREVFGEAIRNNAAAIILCHNHPSGNVEPSDEDIKTTKNLIQASLILGIDVLDHIIVCRNGYFSFMEHNVLFTSEE